MRNLFRILVSPIWALAFLGVLAFTLTALVATRLWATAGEIVVPVRAQIGTARSGRDTQLLMVLVSQAITLGLGVAVYVGVLQQSSVSSLAALITPLATGVVSAIITVVHVTFAHKSYAAELAANVVQPNALPVGVGSGPPPGPAAVVPAGGGPERENVPRGAVPGPGEGVDARRPPGS